ncbi:DUF948 domain-containing protein [Limosilactobacillus sp.]|uniref:DUF948 domain-containing protein n=1 Tax=Limosilactobacillus sp. TaxID=2773925 RepID=UPI003F054302
MTFGQLAGLIAAIAFLILVVFACVVLTQLTKTMRETNNSITLLTRDMDNLSKEVEDVLSNTNSLLEDINKKSSQLDPAVKAVADVSQSVIDINDSLHDMTEKVNARREKAQLGMSLLKTVGKTAVVNGITRFRKRRADKKGVDTDE